MRKVHVDPVNKGLIRFNDDPTAGILVGIEALNVARAINCHDEMLRALENLLADYGLLNTEKGAMAGIDAAKAIKKARELS